MTRYSCWLGTLAGCVGLALTLAGCGGDGGETAPATTNNVSAFSLSGVWTGSWLDSIRTVNFTMVLEEDADGDVTGTYQEAGGIHGGVTGHRDGSNVALSAPLSDGTLMTVEGRFTAASQVSGDTVLHYAPSGASMPYALSMSK